MAQNKKIEQSWREAMETQAGNPAPGVVQDWAESCFLPLRRILFALRMNRRQNGRGNIYPCLGRLTKQEHIFQRGQIPLNLSPGGIPVAGLKRGYYLRVT